MTNKKEWRPINLFVHLSQTHLHRNHVELEQPHLDQEIWHKKGLINFLLYRSYSICSNIEQFEIRHINELEKSDIKQILISNNFPSYIIGLEFENFVKYRMTKKLDKEKSIAKERFLSLPYINEKSELIGSRIQNLVKEHFSNTKLAVAYKSP